MIRSAGISSGHKVLDLATGTGTLARAASDRGASVLGVDLSAGMLAVARRLSPRHIEFVVADASALPVRNGTVDVVTCGLALSHFTNVTTSLGEVQRILYPGGRLVASSWGTVGSNPAFSTILDVLKRHTPGGIHPFAELLDESTWANPESGCQVLQQAGFEPVRATTNRLTGRYSSPQDALRWAFAWPSYGKTLDRFDPPARAAVQTEAIEAMGKASNFKWEYTFNFFVAMKPAC